MRSTTFGLLGATALFGLALVAIMAQQGVPYLPALPIPGMATGQEGVSGGSAVVRGDTTPGAASTATGAPVLAGVPVGPSQLPSGQADGPGPGGSAVDGSRQVGSGAPSDSQPSGDEPATGGAPEAPAPAPSAATTQTASNPASAPSQPSSPAGKAAVETAAVGAAGGNSAGNGNGPRPASTAATKDAQQAAEAPVTQTPSVPNPSSVSAEQAAEEAAALPGSQSSGPKGQIPGIVPK